MAIVALGTSRCVICGSTDLERPYLATSGCPFPREHGLWRYCDGPMHFDCIENWEHRREFSRAYFTRARDRGLQRNEVAAEGPDWVLMVNAHWHELTLAEWPLRLVTRPAEWSDGLQRWLDQLAGHALLDARRISELVAQR